MTPEQWRSMTDDQRFEYAGDVIERVRKANGDAAYYFGFDGGGPATDGAKRYIRSLLKRHAGKADAEVMRWFLNDMMRERGHIDRVSAHAVLKVLLSL